MSLFDTDWLIVSFRFWINNPPKEEVLNLLTIGQELFKQLLGIAEVGVDVITSGKVVLDQIFKLKNPDIAAETLHGF